MHYKFYKKYLLKVTKFVLAFKVKFFNCNHSQIKRVRFLKVTNFISLIIKVYPPAFQWYNMPMRCEFDDTTVQRQNKDSKGLMFKFKWKSETIEWISK